MCRRARAEPKNGYKLRQNITLYYADMAELVDALASGASVRKYVEVQVLLSAPHGRAPMLRQCHVVSSRSRYDDDTHYVHTATC